MAPTGPRTLADGHIKLVALSAAPANLDAPTVTELESGIDISCRVLKSDYRLSATASETIEGMASLCEETNASTPGQSNYEGTLTPFRWFDESGKGGKADPEGDEAFQLLKEKGTELWLVERETGKKYDEAFADGDEVSVFRVVTDSWQKPSDAGGYIRRVVPLFVQDAVLNGAVAAAG